MSSRRRRRWVLMPKVNSVGRQSGVCRAVHSVMVEALEQRTLLSGTFVVNAFAQASAVSADQNTAFAATVAQTPAITSAGSATFLSSVGGTFTITSSGSPTPALTEVGFLPYNVNFTDNGDGTATLLIKPNYATGSYTLTLTAENGIGPTATQIFTLSLDQAPKITSSNHMLFADDDSGFYIVTTSGFPNGAITELGNLPGGLTFHDNGNGTAILSGTPATGTDGTYPLTLTANNGVAPAATQVVTLTVVEPQIITVTTNANSGTGSLRAAITNATSTNVASIIDFAADLSENIFLLSPLPALAGIVAINGPGAGLLTINGNGFGTVFTVGQGVAIEIDNLTITGGHGSLGEGGGIQNASILTVTDCVISENSSNYGAGIGDSAYGIATITDSTITGNFGGGIADNPRSGALTVTDSRVSGNSAYGIFGNEDSGPITVTDSTISGNSSFGINNRGQAALVVINSTVNGNGSNGIRDSAALAINDSTISGNHEAGIFVNPVSNAGTLAINNCTISENSAGYGGGIYDYARGEPLSVTNCTITGNLALRGGGIFNGVSGDLIVTDSTITANSAQYDGGIFVRPSSMTTLDGTIIAANTGVDIGTIKNPQKVNIFGSNDLIADGSDAGLLTNTLRGTPTNPLNPLLAPLGNYGGPTQTMPPLPNSPALGAGANFPILDSNGNDITATDQRGFPRPQTGIDIGADQGVLIPGDTNFDGSVNLTDLLTLLNNYNQSGKTWSQGDFNFDGTVNLTDLLLLLNNDYVSTPTAFAASLPIQPSTPTLFSNTPIPADSDLLDASETILPRQTIHKFATLVSNHDK